MVMQLRDEGRLTLDDRIGDHLADVSHPTTIRQGLAHVSGLQREPVGDIWDSLVQPDEDELLKNFAAVERVGRPHDRWHYSNLVYAVLGRLVATLDGRPWAESLRARLLDPLGMTRTTVGFDGGPHAEGYFVPPFHDVPRPEPLIETRAMAPCGGLASTARDLARWSAFVADPDPAILSPDTVEEMCQPQVLMDPDRWNAGMGLGFFVVRAGDRTWVGHDGGMPGHITSVHTHRESGTGGIVLMNNSDAPDPTAFAIALAERVVDDVPADEAPWPPGTEVPEELAGILGRWYTEGRPVHVLRARGPPGGRRGRHARAEAVGLRRRGTGPLPHGLRARARRAAAGDPRRRRPGHRDALGDVPGHPRAAGVRRAPGVIRRSAPRRAGSSRRRSPGRARPGAGRVRAATARRP